MFSQRPNDAQQPQKAPDIIAIIYAVIVLFAMVGIIMGHQLGLVIAVIAALGWTLGKILDDGLRACHKLFRRR